MTEEAVVRLLLAALAGGVVGVERELRGHVAGVRTHALVAVGAAMFSLAGVVGSGTVSPADPMRVAAQVVSGIGFVGAGAILRDSNGVRGLTTATTVWVSGSLGVATAVGDLVVTGAGIAIVVAILMSRRPIRWLVRRRVRASEIDVDLEYDLGHGTIGPLLRAAEDAESDILQFSLADDETHQPPRRSAHLRLRTPETGLQSLTAAIGEVGDRVEVHQLTLSTAGSKN